MAKVFAFSGGCHSGKTTTMNKVAELLEARGYTVKKLSELMREVAPIKDIDSLRKSPRLYLWTQEKIISEKISQEEKAFADTSDCIYLVDRAITDSLFYLEHYVDKSDLKDNWLDRFCTLDAKARKHMHRAFSHGLYTAVIQFKPIDNITEQDAYRPKRLDLMAKYEYQCIGHMNAGAPQGSMLILHEHKQGVEFLTNYLIKLIEDLNI